jgi:hypothetical protein
LFKPDLAMNKFLKMAPAALLLASFVFVLATPVFVLATPALAEHDHDGDRDRDRDRDRDDRGGPLPIAATGLPGLVLAGGAYLVFRRFRRKVD